MKQLRLIISATALLFAANFASAQTLQNHADSEVFTIGSEAITPESINWTIETYRASLTQGVRQDGMPRFIITGKNKNMILGIGGNVAVRTSYDFGGIAKNLDFITYDINVPNCPKTREQFQIDPSTSTLFFKAIANTSRFGPIVGYIKTDFRGYQNNNLFLREAYISVGGFLVGRNFTSFCDLNATPSTVDFEGPNGYPLLYNTMIRYTYNINNHWTLAIAAEMPNVSATTTGTNEQTIPQRVPDIPIYAQYNWNDKKSHIRASFIGRELLYYDNIDNVRRTDLGWGVQLSGAIQMGRKLTGYFQGIYGEGISAYLQDIYQTGLDLVPNPEAAHRLQALPMMGLIGGFGYTFSSKWAATAVYSCAKVFSRRGYEPDDNYKLGQYVSTNLFYNLTESCQIGLSYMYGSRQNMNQMIGRANRIQTIIQYNF